MTHPRTALLLALLILLPAARGSAADAVSALVDKTVAAYGGVSALSKAKAVLQEGTVTAVQRGKNGEKGVLLRAYERPGRLRVRIAYGANPPEVRILDGTAGWRDGDRVSGPPFDAMVLQAARIDAPWLLREHRARLFDRGTVSSGGRMLRALEIPLAGGMSLVVEIDPSTGRIARTVGKIPGGGMPGMGGIEFATTYDDFREVGGVLFAFREGNFAMGQHTGDTVLTKVEISDRLPEKTFRP